MNKKMLALLMAMGLVACANTGGGKPGERAKSYASDKNCPSGLASEQELKLQMVKDMVAQKKLYAALAQLDSLPLKSPQVMLAKADIQRKLGLTQDAGKYYDALKATCLAGDANHGLGLIAATQGDYVAAVSFLRQAADSRPTDYQIRNDLGMGYMYTGEDDKAHFELMTAMELSTTGDMLPALNLLSLSLVEGDAQAVNQVVSHFDFTGDQLADAMRRCNDVEFVRKAYAKAAKKPGDSTADDADADAGACKWALLEQNQRLSSIIKAPKAVRQ